MTWSRLSLEPSSQSAIFKITQTAARQMLASLLDLFALFATTQMPLYKAWDVQRKERKAVAAGSSVEFAEAGELFGCLISEIQSDMYSECLQRGYGTIIFS